MKKTCKGISSCGRTLDESLFSISRGRITNVCKECHNVRATYYRWKYRDERIDYAQIARSMCQKLIDEKGSKNGK